jgi:transcription factor IIIB 90 kDa subunit
MQALAGQLGVPEPTINSGVQIFKLAANNNFIQGRRMDMVAAVCLYTACRKEKPCRVMLIDFADKVQVYCSSPCRHRFANQF